MKTEGKGVLFLFIHYAKQKICCNITMLYLWSVLDVSSQSITSPPPMQAEPENEGKFSRDNCIMLYKAYNFTVVTSKTCP